MGRPIILNTSLELSGKVEFFPNCVGENGIEEHFEGVSNRGGGLIGILGGFDFLASIAANGRFSHFSSTPYDYLTNLLSLPYDDLDIADFDDLHDFFWSASFYDPDNVKMEETWERLEPIFRIEHSASIGDFRILWEKIFNRYTEFGSKEGLVTRAPVCLDIYRIQDVNLRQSGNSVSWLASQPNYDWVKSLVQSSRFRLMHGNMLNGGINQAQSCLDDVKFNAMYWSIFPIPSSNGGLFEDRLNELRGAGVYVAGGYGGKGMTRSGYEQSRMR
jgi:hypothetical protein